jgi:hypothetical protein
MTIHAVTSTGLGVRLVEGDAVSDHVSPSRKSIGTSSVTSPSRTLRRLPRDEEGGWEDGRAKSDSRGKHREVGGLNDRELLRTLR